jgi:hypothetical protein
MIFLLNSAQFYRKSFANTREIMIPPMMIQGILASFAAGLKKCRIFVYPGV